MDYNLPANRKSIGKPFFICRRLLREIVPDGVRHLLLKPRDGPPRFLLRREEDIVGVEPVLVNVDLRPDARRNAAQQEVVGPRLLEIAAEDCEIRAETGFPEALIPSATAVKRPL